MDVFKGWMSTDLKYVCTAMYISCYYYMDVYRLYIITDL